MDTYIGAASTVEYAAFDARGANEWIGVAKKKAIPKKLFGDLWLEGELAILFGDTGKGKSVLAVQIAESLASGQAVAPMEITAAARKVLYLDLELTDKQFEMRYSADHNGGGAKYLRNHYKFSENFTRVEVDLTEAPKPGSGRFEEFFRAEIERLIDATGASVVILDNITCIKHSYYASREIVPVMRVLRRLKKRLGLSVLVIAHTPKREDSRILGINDLQSSKILGNFADSILAIGQSRLDNMGRYIKQIKVRSSSLVYDATHLPSFRLKKIGGNFLGFEFEHFASEDQLLTDVRKIREWETIERIKKLADDGKKIREIADKLDMSKTTVHRLLQMWREPAVKDTGSEADPADSKEIVRYFPGSDEYDEAGRDTKFEGIDQRDDAEARNLRRESYLIQTARTGAQKIYEKTGICPPLRDNPDYAEFLKSGMAGASATDDDPAGAEPPALAGDTDLSAHNITRGHPTPEHPRHEVDAYGEDIWVEQQDERGKRMIWLKADSNGRMKRYRRTADTTILIEPA
ncbi:MAG TPA: AAA family ATPase [Pyrinomonadaceae bacterium]|nr:AAA family ATPase [Pyrinomonadaceae bacterium]